MEYQHQSYSLGFMIPYSEKNSEEVFIAQEFPSFIVHGYYSITDLYIEFMARSCFMKKRMNEKMAKLLNNQYVNVVKVIPIEKETFRYTKRGYLPKFLWNYLRKRGKFRSFILSKRMLIKRELLNS